MLLIKTLETICSRTKIKIYKEARIKLQIENSFKQVTKIVKTFNQ